MSRYISKLPEPIRALAEKRRSECKHGFGFSSMLEDAFSWENTQEGYSFWESMLNENYSVFYDLYPQKDKLDELIEWIGVEIIWHKGCESDLQVINAYETILNKAKEIKGK